MKHLRHEIKHCIQDTVRYCRLHHWRLKELADRILGCTGMGLLFGTFCAAVLQSISIGFGIAVTTAALAMMFLPE